MKSERPIVLVADDERNAIILLTRIFERDGFQVESARDGQAALEKARSLHPDLILMDVQMPKMNGFEVVEHLREDPATARIPIIFVTAAAREAADVAHGLKLGADDYVRKPYNYNELLARARSKMLARQLEDRLQRRNDEFEALLRIGGELNQRLALRELSGLILEIVRDELGADYAELLLLSSTLRPVYYEDLSGNRDLSVIGDLVGDEHSVIGCVVRSGEPLLVADRDDFVSFGLRPLSADYTSVMAVPFIHHATILGVVLTACRGDGRFVETDFRLFRSIVEQATLAIRNAQLYAELQDYAQNLEAMVEERTQELQAAQAQLVRTEKLAALGRMAAGIAHEVNNPLQPILNCLEVTIEDIESGATPDFETLRIAEREVQRIKTIVSGLLDFSRPSTADMGIVELKELVSEVLALTAKQLERVHIVVRKSLTPVPTLIGNPQQLKQVFLNLILNAMEAMPHGGQLTIDLYEEGNGAIVAITDTGVGMSKETIAHIFDPFYSTKDEGTGLGLAVTYGIVEGHGGQIHVESKQGQGSRFRVWLPYLQG